jgi:hypothetical protein
MKEKEEGIISLNSSHSIYTFLPLDASLESNDGRRGRQREKEKEEEESEDNERNIPPPLPHPSSLSSSFNE